MIKHDSSHQTAQLSRFLKAQEGIYEQALNELHAGQKQTHWMWFVFPQMKGLGSSPTALHYGLHDWREAEAYISHPILGQRLVECTRAALNWTHLYLEDIFPYPDHLKFISCMTTFALIQHQQRVFSEALEAFNSGQFCQRTMEILSEEP